MMIVRDVGFDQLCRPLEPMLTSWVDTVVPRDVELFPNNLYIAPYAWMYSYEKRLRVRLEIALGRPLHGLERILFGSDGVVSEGLSNAFVHGHCRSDRLPIEIECRAAVRGIGLSIRDRGCGFDVERVLSGLNGGRGYFRIAGNGLRALERDPRVLASWDAGGSTLNLRVGLHSGADHVPNSKGTEP